MSAPSSGQEDASGRSREGVELPTGIVTFLYTDIEGSTRRWEAHPDHMKAAVERHDALLREAIGTHGGAVFRTMGDAFCAVFGAAPQAIGAAVAAQLALLAEPWADEIKPLSVRMALHLGHGEVRDGDYVGQPLNRIARLLAAGHGGQTLVSQPTFDVAAGAVEQEIGFLDLGEHRLKDLQRPEHIYQLVAPGLPTEFPRLLTAEGRRTNLPGQSTRFVGREREVAEVTALLGLPEVRLLTLTGPGGTGKTRLSLKVAHTLLEGQDPAGVEPSAGQAFKDGVFFVPLDALSDPVLVPSAIAQAVEVQESGGRPVVENLKGYFRDKRALLVLDNFEQVVDAAPVLTDLTSAAPGLKMLITSRETLRVYGEREYPVPPLDLPDLKRLPTVDRLMDCESVRLFVERAMYARFDFELTEENAPAVVEICARLDGLPLAIELAAARVKLLSPQAMLGKLQSRLKLLTGGARDVPARQQTLRGAIDWGYDLLEAEEKTLFRRLAVFAGGATIEAIEGVCLETMSDMSLPVVYRPSFASSGPIVPLSIDVLDGVQSLVDKSLLRQEERGDEVRFRMLETIREYAWERLDESGEAASIREQHALFYMGFCEEAEWGLRGPQQKTWLDRLEAELDNIRGVFDWSLSDDGYPEVGLRAGGALWQFWYFTGRMSEGSRWLEELLSRVPERTPARAKALYAAAYIGLLQGNPVAAQPWFEESKAIYEELNDVTGRASVLTLLGASLAFTGDVEAGRALGDESIEVFRKAVGKYRWGLVEALLVSGIVALTGEDFDEARVRYEESQAAARARGDGIMTAQALNYLGDLARVQGEYERAGPLYEEALQLFQDVGIKSDIPAMLHNLGYVAVALGDEAGAAELFEESMMLHRDLGNSQGIAECLAGFAALAGSKGQPERAARLLAAAETARGGAVILWPPERIEVARHTASARAQLDESAWQAAWAEGQAMSTEEAVEYALNYEF